MDNGSCALDYLLTLNYIQRTVHVTGELRRSPVQPLAHSRVTSEVRRPVAEDFVQLGLENLQGWRLHSISGQTAKLFSEINFSLDPSWTPFFSIYAHCLFSLPRSLCIAALPISVLTCPLSPSVIICIIGIHHLRQKLHLGFLHAYIWDVSHNASKNLSLICKIFKPLLVSSPPFSWMTLSFQISYSLIHFFFILIFLQQAENQEFGRPMQEPSIKRTFCLSEVTRSLPDLLGQFLRFAKL